MKNNVIVNILRLLISPFTKIQHCKSSCCEFDCDRETESPEPVESLEPINEENNIKKKNL